MFSNVKIRHSCVRNCKNLKHFLYISLNKKRKGEERDKSFVLNFVWTA